MSEPSSPDIVAELDRWLAEGHGTVQRRLWGWDRRRIERARDEIIALRDMVEKQRFVLSKGHAEVRAEERERCVRVAAGFGGPVADGIAAALRAEKIGEFAR